jgi:hypothetical protein
MTFPSSFHSRGLAIVMISLVATACASEHPSGSIGSTPLTATADPTSEVRTIAFEALMSISGSDRQEELGGTYLRFRAYVSPMIGVGTCTVSIASGDGWLNPCAGLSRVLVAAPGRDEGLAAFVPPGMDIDQIPVDQWVEVIGHFDDPAATRCGVHAAAGPTPDDEAVELCRAMFVIDRVSAAN